jgi:hypothetical protein
MTYVFNWKLEALFALGTFLVYLGTAFVATGDAQVTSWSDWFIGSAIAAGRVAVAGTLVALTKLLASLASRRGV